MKKNEENNLIEQAMNGEFSSERKRVKFINSLRDKQIKARKEDFKEKINNAETKEKQTSLKNEYKAIFKKGKDANTDDNVIELRHIHKFYTSKENYEHVLKDINLKIKKSEINVILGASGSGKSTLLNIISGLMNSSFGDVIVKDTNLFYLNETEKTKFRAKNISFVFQSYNLIPTLTALENIKVGYNLKPKDQEFITIDEILKILGLEDRKRNYPFQLSGGQNQRISIGRALAKSPEILFADEPTGALDEEKGREVLQLLIDINAKYKTTLVIVTHNPNFSLIADRVIHVANGEIASVKKNTKKITNAKDVKWA